MSDLHTPSVENAIAGHYDFKVGTILGEAWDKTRGIKGTYWVAFILIMLITFAIFFVQFGIGAIIGVSAMSMDAEHETITMIAGIAGHVLNLISIFITAPLSAGMLMIGIKHCCYGVHPKARSVFDYYKYWRRLWVYPFIIAMLSIINSLIVAGIHYYLPPDAGSTVALIALSYLIFFLAFLYVAIRFLMFTPLIVEKQLTVGQALSASRRAIGHHWFKTLWFLIVICLIMIGSALTLGILYIWTLPMFNNAMAILYREIFGVTQPAITSA